MGRRSTIPSPYCQSTKTRRTVIAKIDAEDAALLFDECGGAFVGIQQFIIGNLLYKLVQKVKQDGKLSYDPDNIDYLSKLIGGISFDGIGRTPSRDDWNSSPSDDSRGTGQVHQASTGVAGQSADTKSGSDTRGNSVGIEVAKPKKATSKKGGG